MEHVEYLQPGLVDGQDDSPIGAGHAVQVVEQLQGRGGIQPWRGLVQEYQTGHVEQLYSHAQATLLTTTQTRASGPTHLDTRKAG